MKINLEDLKLLKIEEGDVLVVRESGFSGEIIKEISEFLKCKVIVVESLDDIKAIRLNKNNE